MDDLMKRLEKTAGLLGGVANFAKNVSGLGVRKAEKNLAKIPEQAKTRPFGQERINLAQKELKNAKVDRNRARAGAGAVAVAGGAGLGGYTAYQKSKEPVVEDVMKANQVTEQELPKVAETLMDRLEKTANENYDNHMADKRINEITWDLADQKDPKYLESALAQEGLLDRAVELGVFKDITPGAGAALGGLVGGIGTGVPSAIGGAVIGGMTGGLKGAAKLGAGAGAAGALIGGGLLAGAGAAEGLYRKAVPSDMHMKYHSGAPNQAAAPEEEQQVEDSRQGAGSISNAAAGEDKTASELMERLEKTASSQETVDPRLVGGTVGGISGLASGFAAGKARNGVPGALVGSAVTGSLGAAGGALLGQGLDAAQQEKTAGVNGLASSGVKKLKNFGADLSGKNYKDAKKAFDTQNTPEALKANAPKTGVSKFRNQLEALEKNKADAKTNRNVARVSAGAGLGAGAGAGALAASESKKDEQEKQASHEEQLQGLYKEAAEAITQQVFPEVKQHVDPMSQIRF